MSHIGRPVVRITAIHIQCTQNVKKMGQKVLRLHPYDQEAVSLNLAKILLSSEALNSEMSTNNEKCPPLASSPSTPILSLALLLRYPANQAMSSASPAQKSIKNFFKWSCEVNKIVMFV